MEQLFLIEILVETISFSAVDPIPQKKQIYITARFGNFANLEIRYDGIAMGEETTKMADIEFSTGKSYLFPCKASALLEALKKDPLELTVGTKTDPLIGKASYTWTNEFISMLEYCDESVGYITPTSVREVFSLIDNNGVTTGLIDVFIRLSCFGKSIQTQFQIIPNKDTKNGAPKSQYLFKSTNAATTFQCERYGLGTSADILPVAPVYNPIELEDTKALTAVYKAVSQSVCGSIIPSVFELELEGNVNSTLVSGLNEGGLRERPPNAKFTKLEELQGELFKKVYEDEELTPENINKLLCKHRDCPAAKKFKEFGLGPLATGSGLGTVYGEVEPPTSYGISHTHGKLERYGPYGVYYRPKRVEQEFVPKPPSDDEKSSTHLRLRGGCSLSPLRLSGGEIHPPLRLNGGAPMEETLAAPSPLLACKDLMADFDKILVAYKKALGPCGHASCPFAENLIAESCKIVCPGRDEKHVFPLTPVEMMAQAKAPSDNDDSVSTCGIPSCPYSRKMTQPVEEEFKLGQIKSACGDPTCPYVKRRCQLDDEETDEATVQLASLPKTCGAVKCPFTPQPNLPPIHWDCPDPLPKGLCKNPNCPVNKREQLAACIFQPPISPCHVPTCPHKIPPPCNYPGCPFGPPLTCNIPGCPYSLPPVCTDPNCPLYDADRKQNGSSDTLCRDDTCPNRGGDYEGGGETEEGPIEVCSGDTMEPCTPNTCKMKGGVFECTVCNGRGRNKTVCPCSDKSKKKKADEGEGEPVEGAVEVCSGDTIEPCTPNTCKARGGNLECVVCKGKRVCPCSAKPRKDEGDRSSSGGPIEVCSGDTLEPCTPHTCASKQGKLKCTICGGDAIDEDDELLEESPTEYVSGDTVEPCTPNTCAGKGGALICDECAKKSKKSPCPCTSPRTCTEEGDQRKPSARKQKLSKAIIQSLIKGATPPKGPQWSSKHKRLKRKTNFVYDTGDTYPGVKIGHRECVTPRSNVPHNMGWLWNIKPPGRLKPRRGWKPGALTKTMASTIIQHRLKSGIKPLIIPPPTQKPKKKPKKMNAYGVYESDSDDQLVAPKPTLQIKKKDGCYMITMNPLKDPFALEDNESPYMDCTPLQFKITKKPNQTRAKDDEEAEESSCGCVDDRSTSDSELDIEFTPPAGILHPEKMKKKKNVIHTDTQYCPGDFSAQPAGGETLQLEKKPKEEKKGGKKEKKGGKKGKKK